MKKFILVPMMLALLMVLAVSAQADGTHTQSQAFAEKAYAAIADVTAFDQGIVADAADTIAHTKDTTALNASYYCTNEAFCDLGDLYYGLAQSAQLNGDVFRSFGISGNATGDIQSGNAQAQYNNAQYDDAWHTWHLTYNGPGGRPYYNSNLNNITAYDRYITAQQLFDLAFDAYLDGI